jgi:hypothetical protein
MRYGEWLLLLHPHTRAHYYQAVARRYDNEPNVIVFIDSRNKRSDAGGEVFDWLEVHAPDRWFDVCAADAENFNIIGFYDEDTAMTFKLTYGNNYDPRIDNLNLI